MWFDKNRAILRLNLSSKTKLPGFAHLPVGRVNLGDCPPNARNRRVNVKRSFAVKKKFQAYWIIALLAVIGFSMTGCPAADGGFRPGGPDAFTPTLTFSDWVYYETEDGDPIFRRFPAEETRVLYNPGLGLSGEIAGGRFSLTVATPSAAYLRGITDLQAAIDWLEGDDVTIRNPRTRVFMDSEFCVGGNSFFSRRYESVLGDHASVSYLVRHVFADWGVTVSAGERVSVEEEGAHTRTIKAFTLALNRGWNIVNERRERIETETGIYETLTVSYGNLGYPVRWVFEEPRPSITVVIADIPGDYMGWEGHISLRDPETGDEVGFSLLPITDTSAVFGFWDMAPGRYAVSLRFSYRDIWVEYAYLVDIAEGANEISFGDFGDFVDRSTAGKSTMIRLTGIPGRYIGWEGRMALRSAVADLPFPAVTITGPSGTFGFWEKAGLYYVYVTFNRNDVWATYRVALNIGIGYNEIQWSAFALIGKPTTLTVTGIPDVNINWKGYVALTVGENNTVYSDTVVITANSVTFGLRDVEPGLYDLVSLRLWCNTGGVMRVYRGYFLNLDPGSNEWTPNFADAHYERQRITVRVTGIPDHECECDASCDYDYINYTNWLVSMALRSPDGNFVASSSLSITGTSEDFIFWDGNHAVPGNYYVYLSLLGNDGTRVGYRRSTDYLVAGDNNIEWDDFDLVGDGYLPMTIIVTGVPVQYHETAIVKLRQSEPGTDEDPVAWRIPGFSMTFAVWGAEPGIYDISLKFYRDGAWVPYRSTFSRRFDAVNVNTIPFTAFARQSQ